MSTPSRLLLLDTNIVIHLTRGSSVGQAIDERFQLRARADRPLLSVVSLGEALAFAQLRNWGQRSTEILRSLLRELVIFDIRSQAVLDRYAQIASFLKRNGRTVGDNDVWIAACTAAADATLLTTDRDFDSIRFKARI
jgi:tRNA(fMet)-specific endonuclease VapC